MVYHRQYNTRNSTGGRYNTPGQFVTAVPQQQQQQLPQQQQVPQQQQRLQPPPQQPQPQMQAQSQFNQQRINQLQTPDVEMNPEPDAESAGAAEDAPPARPYWMKSKLPGVRKITKKEKRRRQNEQLRRLLTPKSALMVLNEMLLHEQLTNQQFKVEAAEASNQYYKSQKTSFCADLTLDGVSYKGYGENKLTARNAAAEQAIRDLIIKRMQKAASINVEEALAAAGAGEEGSEAGAEEPLPMIQLASFALHKLFSEWEYDGHKVPNLKPLPAGGQAAGAEPEELPPPVARAPRLKELPLNAAAMHPCMLLTYMRPALEYRELAVTGDRPQNMLFTMGVDVDAATYIGKASNKKEARKAAAKAACTALFGVTFHDAPTASAPLHAPAPAAAPASAPASASASAAQ